MTRSCADPLYPAPQMAVNHALGRLIRVLSTLPPTTNSSLGISAQEFRLWFLSRFDLPDEDCTAKTFGDTVNFAIRLGLIPLKRRTRTKSKLTYYLGITTRDLDTLANRCSCEDEAVAMCEDLPLPPWDADRLPELQADLNWEAYMIHLTEDLSPDPNLMVDF